MEEEPPLDEPEEPDDPDPLDDDEELPLEVLAAGVGELLLSDVVVVVVALPELASLDDEDDAELLFPLDA